MPATVLIADDEAFIVDLLASLLEDEGYHVLRAYDGAAALESLRRDHPDLLLTDNMMPRMTGAQVIGYLHAHPEIAVPVILMSAVPPVPGSRHTTFLPKPFDIADVLTAVAALLPAP